MVMMRNIENTIVSIDTFIQRQTMKMELHIAPVQKYDII